MALTEEQVQRGAQRLLDARAQGIRLAGWPAELAPANQSDAEAICEAMARGFEQPMGGWKVGAMDTALAVKRGLERPFCGQIPRGMIYPNGASVPWDELLRPVVEAEIVFLLGRDIPPRSAPYTAEEIMDAVEAVLPGIEIPESRLVDGHPLGALGMVADQGFAGRLVCGAPLHAWRALELASLKAELWIDDVSVAHGTGAKAMGNPIEALLWLANYRGWCSGGLRRGEVVSTGSLTGVQATAKGQHVTAVFEGLGTVAMQMI